MPNDPLTIDQVWHVPDGLRAVRPEAVHQLDTANGWSWRAYPPTLLELVRLTVAGLIGNEAALQRRSGAARELGLSEAKIGELRRYDSSPEFTELERDCLALVEQFVIDVSGPMQEHVLRLGKHFTEAELRGFVVALYLTECTQRLELAAGLLLGMPEPQALAQVPALPSTEALAEMHTCLREYQNAVVRGTALDPVVTELVRLRCARTHNCSICKTLRLSDAREAGVDDTMTAKVDFYERSDLGERCKAALRITDAFISRPDTLDESVIVQARTMFSTEQLVELCLDITKWSTQKIHVALGTDGAESLPTNDQGVSFLSFDDQGLAAFSATLS